MVQQNKHKQKKSSEYARKHQGSDAANVSKQRKDARRDAEKQRLEEKFGDKFVDRDKPTPPQFRRREITSNAFRFAGDPNVSDDRTELSATTTSSTGMTTERLLSSATEEAAVRAALHQEHDLSNKILFTTLVPSSHMPAVTGPASSSASHTNSSFIAECSAATNLPDMQLPDWSSLESSALEPIIKHPLLSVTCEAFDDIATQELHVACAISTALLADDLLARLQIAAKSHASHQQTPGFEAKQRQQQRQIQEQRQEDEQQEEQEEGLSVGLTGSSDDANNSDTEENLEDWLDSVL